ncbi:MAG: hypothetical protein E3J87_01535 [Candidatus Cloacimonadota bacterium]|nr:MAG: hypothetical protein E3J87_01535 [Candidatus Cloacimonadota bacterium]
MGGVEKLSLNPKEICVTKRSRILRKMELEKFIEEVSKKNQEELEKIRRFQEIMNQLVREKTETYVVSITSDL